MNTFLKIIYPGIGIVCMVNNTALSLLKQSNDSNSVETCLFTSQEGGKNGLVLISKHLENKS